MVYSQVTFFEEVVLQLTVPYSQVLLASKSGIVIASIAVDLNLKRRFNCLFSVRMLRLRLDVTGQ